MITLKEYKQAKKIVDEYEMQSKIVLDNNHKNLRKGDYVKTTKGCRFNGIFFGHIVGFTKWRNYHAVKVKKESSEFTNRRIVICLAKNLIKI